MTNVKRCPSCDKVVVGRADKKFCDSHCRNDFNNQLNRVTTNYMRKVNQILRQNRRILLRLDENGIKKCTKDNMLYEGFQFNYFTHLQQGKDGTTQFFCYERGVAALDNDWFKLVEKQET